MRPNLTETICCLAALTLTAPFAAARADEAAERQFVAAFGEACIPERLSHRGTLDHVATLGWEPVAPGKNPAADRLIATAVAELAREKAEDDFAFEGELAFFTRTIGTRTYLLAVSAVLSEYIDLNGCYLYDFAAKEPVDPALVSTLLGTEPAYSTDGDDPYYAADPAELISTVWGPPPGLPRTMDTYLTFIPADSPIADRLGFTGAVLKFSTSLPDAGTDDGNQG